MSLEQSAVAVLELVRAGQQGRDNCLALTASSRIRTAFGIYQKGNELVASDWYLHLFFRLGYQTSLRCQQPPIPGFTQLV